MNKNNLKVEDVQKLVETAQKQATTMENKAISNQSQQVIQTEGKIDKKAISLKTLGNDKYAIKMPNSNFKFEKTGNVNEDILDESMSKYFNNSSETKKLNQTFKTIIRDKGIAIKFDENVTDADGNIVDGKYENGVMTINPNSERAFEYIATHELTHAIGTKQMIDMVERFRESNAELDENVKTLLDSYAEGDITEEALADISAQLFGTQQFIENVKNTNPNLFQKIYNEIKYLWHQFRGYKNQNEFIEDLYHKWTKAYNSNANLNQTEKYLFTGRNSRLQNSDAFKLAEQMKNENASDAEILEKTGWFFDTEDGYGKWKYEIDDSKSKLLLNDSIYNLMKKSEEGLTLKDVFENDELFKAYPELATYKVEFVNDKDSGVNGSFYSDEKKLVLNLANYEYKNNRKYLENAFEKSVEAVLKLCAVLPNCVYPQFVRMNQNEEELELFFRYWNEKSNASNGNLIIQKYDDFAGLLPECKPADLSPLERNVCWHLRRDFTILLNGDVPSCKTCLFDQINGNVFESSLEEIWQKNNSLIEEQIKNNYNKRCGKCDEYYTFNF